MLATIPAPMCVVCQGLAPMCHPCQGACRREASARRAVAIRAPARESAPATETDVCLYCLGSGEVRPCAACVPTGRDGRGQDGHACASCGGHGTLPALGDKSPPDAWRDRVNVEAPLGGTGAARLELDKCRHCKGKGVTPAAKALPLFSATDA